MHPTSARAGRCASVAGFRDPAASAPAFKFSRHRASRRRSRAHWLRALRALLGELTCLVLWFGPQARAGVGAAWRRAGWAFGMREICQGAAFERLFPNLRGILLDDAGAVVRHPAGRRAPGGKATPLRSTVTQWSADQRGGAGMA